ncbi:putative transcriptional regulator [Bacillus thermophilus]|uniref:Transcriptional regulator n=2 Tax=Siminovitchia TaxID=2837510 RepID=A0ABS2R703_9BACI|nr:putative transcriptional regulator [Siminovitchia thermophila]
MPLMNRKIKNRIVILRAERNLSQKDVADGVGVSRQTIISLEKNRYNPSLKLAFDLALFFGVDVHDVFQYELEEDH